MKPRFYPYLDLLLVSAVLAAGVYAYRHPATARRCLDALSLSADEEKSASANWVDRLNSPVTTPSPPAGKAQSWGMRIAAGHAFPKHGRAMGFRTPGEMAAFIDRVIASPSASRSLSRGRHAYWDDGSGTVVICDPSTADGGTAFKPDRGRRYYDSLR